MANDLSSPACRRAAAAILAAGLMASAASGAWAQGADTALSDLLLKQTQAFSDAGQAGDAATLAKYLDPEVVFMNETGAIVTRKDIVDGASPPPPGVKRAIKTTEFALRQQRPDLATATFVDVVTQDFHGQPLVFRYRSTETWAKEADGWKMVASQTMTVPQDPPAVALPAAELDAYVGVYQLDPSFKVDVRRDGVGLTSSSNGAPPTPLKVEARDVLFTPGVPTGRRIFQRDNAGHVTGYISRRDGVDIVLKKVG